MKFVIALLIVFFVSLGGSAFAASVEDGKALFGDPKLGTTGKTCNSCHPSGKGLEKAGTKGEWKISGGGSAKSLEESINSWITKTLKGKALEEKSDEMKSLTMYIKSIGGDSGKTTKKKPAVGC